MRHADLLPVGLALLVACSASQPSSSGPVATARPPAAGEAGPARREARAPVLEAVGRGSAETPAGSNGASVLEELQELGDAAAAEVEPSGGGSIRAKKEVELARANRLDRDGNLLAKVEALLRGRFPLVALRVRVIRAARTGKGAEVGTGAILVVAPEVATRGQEVDLSEPANQLNAGAYYLKPGDKVAIRLGEKRGETWIADYVERK